MNKNCKKHGFVKFNKGKDDRYKAGYRYICSKCAYESVRKRRYKLKSMAVEYKGGSCVRCGYNKSYSALEFHHIDPSKKDFGIGGSTNMSWKKIQEELDKCELVCANCHREIHDELRLEDI